MATDINKTLEDLRSAIKEFTSSSGECCGSGGSKVGAAPSTTSPQFGDTEDEYQTSEQFYSARCNASNAIYDTILGVVDWMVANGVEFKALLFGSLTTGLVFALLASGPAGWALAASGTILTALATWIIKEAIDFGGLSSSMDNVHESLVKSLYNAGSTTAAKENFLSILAGATPTPTSAMLFLVEIMLSEDLLNNIFEPRSDLAIYVSPDEIDCGGTLLLWTFPSDAEGWTFRDDSTANASAVGSYDGAAEALSHAQIILSGGTGRITRAVDVSPVLSQVVLAGNSVQADHDAVSDGIVVFRILKVIYTDTSEYTQDKGSHTGAGSIILTITVPGTIETIELTTGRSNGGVPSGFSFTTKTLEVRIQ